VVAALVALSLIGAPNSVGAAASHRACESLAHVGDSLTFRARSQFALQYSLHGWSRFRIDAKGGRGIASFMYDDVTGLEAVRRIKATGFDGCWVMALGTNDTANADEFGASPKLQRAWRLGLIRSMMDELDGAPVMWVNTHLISPTATYSTADAAAWNQALVDVAADYPNMMVFDFDAVAAGHREWTGPDDVHDTPLGSAHRAELVAQAATTMLRGAQVQRSRLSHP
jgi:hypothetical protein